MWSLSIGSSASSALSSPTGPSSGVAASSSSSCAGSSTGTGSAPRRSRRDVAAAGGSSIPAEARDELFFSPARCHARQRRGRPTRPRVDAACPSTRARGQSAVVAPRSRRRSRSRSRSPCRAVRIQRLSTNVTGAHLREIFGHYGTVTDVELLIIARRESPFTLAVLTDSGHPSRHGLRYVRHRRCCDQGDCLHGPRPARRDDPQRLARRPTHAAASRRRTEQKSATSTTNRRRSSLAVPLPLALAQPQP